MKTTETKSKFIALRAQGMSFRNIAKQLHIALSTCFDWQSKLQGHIDLAQQAEIDAVMEQYKLERNSRLKRLGIVLEKLEKEIEQRDLSDVPTEKLLTMYINGLTAIKGEGVADNTKLAHTYNDLWMFAGENSPELLDAPKA